MPEDPCAWPIDHPYVIPLGLRGVQVEEVMPRVCARMERASGIG